VVITKAFVRAAEARAKSLGIPDFPRVVVDHPLASRKADLVREMARVSMPKVVDALLGRAQGMIMADGGGR
jgi:hypothetical protein